MLTTPLLIALAACVLVTVAVAAVLFRTVGKEPSAAEGRLAALTGAKPAGDALREEIVREGYESLTGALGKFGTTFGNVPLYLEQADSPLKPHLLAAVMGGCAVLGLAVAAIARAPFPLWPPTALFFATFPIGWLWWRRKSRFDRFAKQLPDALELIGRALRSGHSLSSGLHVVVAEMPAPVSEEFGRAYEEQNLGIPIEQSLKNMLRRMPNLDLKFFATAVAIQRQAGGDLAEILDKISYIIRERFKILGQVKALTGEGRISGVVLMALPIALFAAVYYLNPTYVMMLFVEPQGRTMIAAAAVLQVLGAVAIKKIVAIKV